MARIGITQQDVINAINQIKAAGDKVTQAAILKITGGSPNTVNKIVRALNESAPAVAPQSMQLPSELVDTLTAAINQAASKARTEVAEQIKELEDNNQSISDEADALQSRLDELEPQVATLQSEKDKAETLATERAAQVARLTEQLATQATAAEQTRNELAKVALELKAANEAKAKHQEAIKAAESTATAAKEQAENANKARIEAEKKLAVSEARIESEKTRADDLAQREKDLRVKYEKLNADHISALNKFSTETAALNTKLTNAQADLNKANELIKTMKEAAAKTANNQQPNKQK